MKMWLFVSSNMLQSAVPISFVRPILNLLILLGNSLSSSSDPSPNHSPSTFGIFPFGYLPIRYYTLDKPQPEFITSGAELCPLLSLSPVRELSSTPYSPFIYHTQPVNTFLYKYLF